MIIVATCSRMNYFTATIDPCIYIDLIDLQFQDLKRLMDPFSSIGFVLKLVLCIRYRGHALQEATGILKENKHFLERR